MAFWSKKSIKDSLNKYLSEQGVSCKEEAGYITFDLYFKKSEYTIYPYLKIDEYKEEASIIINIKEVTDSYKDFSKLNSFNTKSKYFNAKVNDGALYLEYNTHLTLENAGVVLEDAIKSLFSLQEDIDKL